MSRCGVCWWISQRDTQKCLFLWEKQSRKLTVHIIWPVMNKDRSWRWFIHFKVLLTAQMQLWGVKFWFFASVFFLLQWKPPSKVAQWFSTVQMQRVRLSLVCLGCIELAQNKVLQEGRFSTLQAKAEGACWNVTWLIETSKKSMQKNQPTSHPSIHPSKMSNMELGPNTVGAQECKHGASLTQTSGAGIYLYIEKTCKLQAHKAEAEFKPRGHEKAVLLTEPPYSI